MTAVPGPRREPRPLPADDLLTTPLVGGWHQTGRGTVVRDADGHVVAECATTGHARWVARLGPEFGETVAALLDYIAQQPDTIRTEHLHTLAANVRHSMQPTD